jgi:hypothetical protein
VRAARLRLALVVALLGGLAALDAGGAPATAAGATIVEIGWWSQAPGTATPPGGFEVAKTAEGELSVAALRIQVDGPLDKALLILVEAPGGTLQESAAINACPSSAAWTAASPGPLEAAPAADCATKVPLQRDPAAGTWTADLRPLLAGAEGPVTVVLKPGEVTQIVAPEPDAPQSPVPLPVPAPVGIPAPPTTPVPVPPVPAVVDPGFTAEFSRADLDAAGSSDGGGSATFSGPSPTPSAGAFATGAAPTFTPTESFAFSSSPSLTPVRDALPAATPQVAPSGAGGAGTAANLESGLQPVAAAGGTPPPWGRLLLLIPLSMAIGAAGSFVRRRALGLGATA